MNGPGGCQGGAPPLLCSPPGSHFIITEIRGRQLAESDLPGPRGPPCVGRRVGTAAGSEDAEVPAGIDRVMAPIKIYGLSFSGNVTPVQLLCKGNGIEMELVNTDLKSGAHKTP
eukprot:751325-Hanusia_phi.AAC.1